MWSFAETYAWVRRHRWDGAAILLIVVVAAVPRLLDLGLFVTADEKNWMGRSYEFIRAFKDLRFNDMLQTTHPGVTTMWLAGLSITVKMFASGVPFSFNHIAHFAAAAQLPIALAATLLIPATYVFLRLALGTRSPGESASFQPQYALPLLAALLIALDPFLIGYSRVAHVDALLAHLLFAAALAIIIYRQQGYDRRWLVAAAVMASAALLTKAPAVFLLPFLLLVIATDRTQWRWPAWRDRSRDVVAWLLLAGLLFVLAWPALIWVPDQQGNVLVLKRDLVTATVTPHHMAEDYTLNAWHYPATLLTRTTPITFVFASIALITLIISTLSSFKKLPVTRYPLPVTPAWFLVAYVFFFILMMTLGAKKGDRYILPVWPALDTLAAAGLVWGATAVGKRFENWSAGWRMEIGPLAGGWKFRPSLLLLAASILYLVSVVAWYHPYTLAYSNPLFPDNLSQELGWGEGLEQVAAWLNQHAPHARVASWYPEELQAFTTARVSHINAHAQPSIQYVVMYRNMFGRAPDHYANDFIDEYYKKREPVFVASVTGKEFAWVYRTRAYETVTPELIPPLIIEQTVTVDHENLSSIEVMVATHQGRANQGQLIIRIMESDRRKLQESRFMIAEIADNSWVRVPLTTAVPKGVQLRVAITAEGTAAQQAPVIRLTRESSYRPGDVRYQPVSASSAGGDLALRLRYQRRGVEVSEEETRLIR